MAGHDNNTVAPDSNQTITLNVRTVFSILKEIALQDKWSPENVEATWGTPPAYKIRELAQKIVDLLNHGRVVIPAKWTDYLVGSTTTT